jgi:RNA polymerase sigma-70 factor (family 1)
VAKDDHQAFGLIFAHYWDKIYSMALIYTKSIPRAEDLVQDIFIQVWNKRDKLPGIRSFDDWLFILSRNAIITAIRATIETVPLDGGTYKDPQDPEDQWPADDPLPDQLFAVKESRALIDLAVGSLPPQQQKIYRLSREEGHSHKEIAAELGISVSTVKGHVTQALHHIRVFLHDHNNRAPIIWGLILTAILEK